MIIVAQTDPREPAETALLKQSHELMRSLFPPEDNSFLNTDELAAPHIRFFSARIGTDVCGTGALVLKEGYGEVKSMFVSEAARGQGVADAILRQIEDEARDHELSTLKLETGDVLYAAHKLYARHGFSNCGVFGDYRSDSRSIFMEKSL